MNEFFDARMKTLVAATLSLLSFFLLIEALTAIADIQIKKKTILSNNVITGRGTAKIVAIPDIANFSITVREESKTVEEAQQKMVAKANKAIDLLKENKIEKTDIRTENYTTYPKYTYISGVCKRGICPPTKQVLSGYEAVEGISVKVRDAKKAGEIVSGIAALQIGEVSSMAFEIEDTEKFKIQARAEAIKKAKEDAKSTAESLGVTLGKVVRFNEEGGGYYPMENRAMMMTKSFDSASAPVAPQLEAGEQRVSATVSVTYEMSQ